MSRFENAFASFVGVKHACTVNNGTAALHLALLCLGIGHGDEVIVPTFTYVASVNAITYTGATPVFVDSLMTSWQMDPNDIRKKLTTKTRAIMAVHIYGHPCEMDELEKIVRENDLFLIEDCAEAFGSFYRDKHTGRFGDISTFSFFGNKTITTGEGGMIVTDSETLLERAHHYKGQGLARNREYWHDVIGYNYRMTNVCAAIGLAQLEQAESFLRKKKLVADWYRIELKDLPVTFHEEVGEIIHSYWMCSILAEDSTTRDSLRNFLMRNGIETRPFFPPVHSMPMYASDSQVFPVANHLSCCGLNLPSYQGLSKQDVLAITSCITDFFDGENDKKKRKGPRHGAQSQGGLGGFKK